jgi:hypothetical protein
MSPEHAAAWQQQQPPPLQPPQHQHQPPLSSGQQQHQQQYGVRRSASPLPPAGYGVGRGPGASPGRSQALQQQAAPGPSGGQAPQQQQQPATAAITSLLASLAQQGLLKQQVKAPSPTEDPELKLTRFDAAFLKVVAAADAALPGRAAARPPARCRLACPPAC